MRTAVDYSARFTSLTVLLASYRELWQQSHFIQLSQQWQLAYPVLTETLLNLPDEQVDNYYRAASGALDLVARDIPELSALEELTYFPLQIHQAVLPVHLSNGVSGRKWAQIQAFIGAIEDRSNTTTVVDWCSGKAHLGRSLAVSQGKALHALERDSHLCSEGLRISQNWLENVRLSQVDVLAAPVDFAKTDEVLALHACGDLHRKLLHDWQRSASSRLILVPCCYHKWLNSDYQPLSQMARTNNLYLTKEQVQLAVQEWVTASGREQRQSQEMMKYRLAFDVLQRELRGEDNYLPAPSLPYGILREGARGVLQQLCASKGLTLPAGINWQEYVERGAQQYQRYRRLQLLNHSFRRALECWLILDLILYLEEGGATVNAVAFCQRELTPRNIMLQATR